MLRKEIYRMLQGANAEGEITLDLTKVSLFMTKIAGIILTSYAVIAQADFAEVLFVMMITAGVGTTISKDVVEVVQRRKGNG